MRKAVLIERDGILVETIVKDGRKARPCLLADFRTNGVNAIPMARLKQAKFMIFVITNQPDISKGALPRRILDRMHFDLRNVFPAIDEIYVCPHEAGDLCSCRSPEPGLILEAQHRWGLDPSQSFIVSDYGPDIRAGRKARFNTILIESVQNGTTQGDCKVRNFGAAVKVITDFNKRTK